MKNPLFMESIVDLVQRDGYRYLLFEPTLEECDYLYSQGVLIQQFKNSIYPARYKLTLEKYCK